MSARTRAFITGCNGLQLSAPEEAFIATMRPWGLILFKRNIQDVHQVQLLTERFRALVERADAPVLIDQEGGRVQRMGPPNWRKYPAAADIGELTLSLEARAQLVHDSARLMSEDLRECGVNVDCLPVLDIRMPGAHDVIGDRAYGRDAASVAALGKAACEGMLAGKVLPVVKHMPGHGRANSDSHFELPVVTASLAELDATDFAPFRALNMMPLAMSAHVVYEAIDPHLPATVSRKVVREIIRGAIGFDGLLMSDDLAMKALKGTYSEKTRALFDAGLDIALYCHFDAASAQEVAVESPFLEGQRAERASRALNMIAGSPESFDGDTAWATLQAQL